MEVVKAQIKYLRKSPSKVGPVVRQIKGRTVNEALSYLKFMGKGSAKPLFKLVESAVANAENNFNLKRENLKILKIEVLKGPMLKRWRPRSRGMAHPILKKSSHIKIYLTSVEDLKKKAPAARKGEIAKLSLSKEAPQKGQKDTFKPKKEEKNKKEAKSGS
ncbi:50S ribosomal protein L22 [candidate division WWE3 bacterium CG06_land_8_20_14_3_00_42_16]|uniref:Large ribosomal subunit protein uL22 n=4 Tax=Katanobacteria TaxID=422282 RepID=A0A2M7AMN4_UNCKA|nr:MAG: 50S ribosomal protein L22 [bacterium CG1_02_42_9]PIU68643.1 MAG: 50S ribosomal protein L22 [candidate division WWE3 bacterium CG06_land_8_20_14_3_00_42_16]PIZ43002.1 MAG: 50S ribosomal protein L22 [candidate division WWE3 bacterium CG_4_10_14_0_2_um_filter_42_8]PJA37986.1 MAG: 50S ribosomal protein L22 [candidate division WWE3 bacterium CG_4_9_14_3_um_filter_43_9]PJC69364.1 MAG: 50S ribosomal protein L22 [candidate division WWE3 bacterium CG_4_8_14_3_um_filter_42_11]